MGAAFCVPVSIRIAVLTGTIDSTSSLIDLIRTAKVIAARVVDGSFLRVELSWFRTENGGAILDVCAVGKLQRFRVSPG
jgi:hypothetical protein